MPPPSARDTRVALLNTYRYLRLGIVILVLLLGVAILLDRFGGNPLQDSVSAYYYTDVHPVLIASLCATGACLVIYRGLSDLADLLLNVSGFLAVVVALVPTPCNDTGPYCPASRSMVLLNVYALLLTTAVTLALAYVFSVRQWWPSIPRSPINPRVKMLYWITVAAFLALGAWVYLGPRSFMAHGHLFSAITLFACMVLVVGLHGWVLNERNRASAREHQRLQRFYWSSFVLTLIGVAVLATLTNWQRLTGSPSPLPKPGFWLELWVLGSFGVFWLTQTFTEVWDDPVRPALDSRAWV